MGFGVSQGLRLGCQNMKGGVMFTTERSQKTNIVSQDAFSTSSFTLASGFYHVLFRDSFHEEPKP